MDFKNEIVDFVTNKTGGSIFAGLTLSRNGFRIPETGTAVILSLCWSLTDKDERRRDKRLSPAVSLYLEVLKGFLKPLLCRFLKRFFKHLKDVSGEFLLALFLFILFLFRHLTSPLLLDEIQVPHRRRHHLC